MFIDKNYAIAYKINVAYALPLCDMFITEQNGGMQDARLCADRFHYTL